jgi:hypothetical protein
MTLMTTSIRTPFGYSSTADDVIDGIDLSGRRAIVRAARPVSASKPPVLSPRRGRR